jgi:hypothetical protein
VITSRYRSALLVVLDEQRRDVGVVTIREGETHGGYTVATVEPDRVFFERNGTLVPVVVGRPYTGPKGGADAPPRPKFFFVPGPEKLSPELEYSGPQRRIPPNDGGTGEASGNAPDNEAVRNLLERVFSSPQMQEQLPKMRPSIQELERVRQDRLPDSPGLGSNAPPQPPR